jgi:hypothetical protein
MDYPHWRNGLQTARSLALALQPHASRAIAEIGRNVW